MRRAGVSAFGGSGTNAHLILRRPRPRRQPDSGTGPGPAEAPAPAPCPGRCRPSPRCRTGPGRPPTRRRRAPPRLDPADVGWSLATTRATLPHRGVVVAADRAQALAGLTALATGEPAAHAVAGQADTDAKVTFVFPGQGGQWTGMAVELLDTSAVFADHIRACETALAPYVDWSSPTSCAPPRRARPDRVDVVQPALFAVMVSLAALWQSYGVRPTPSSATPRARSPPRTSPGPSPSTTPPASSPCAAGSCANSPATAA
ncbi:acyltransferase domain-containing protein [Streptomyces sp. M19]